MKVLFWLYLVNSVLLINHEIDSAYWKEWRQFNVAFGWFNNDDNTNMKWFLIIHFFLLFIILLGIIEVYNSSIMGYIISIIVASGGLFAFFFHNYYRKKGRKEFNLGISQFILIAILIISTIQFCVTLFLIST